MYKYVLKETDEIDHLFFSILSCSWKGKIKVNYIDSFLLTRVMSMF